jgi:hypothetical protein
VLTLTLKGIVEADVFNGNLQIAGMGESPFTWGKNGDFGAIRSVASEILVGRTDLSYNYTQPAREGPPYNLYHGTLEAKPGGVASRTLLRRERNL